MNRGEMWWAEMPPVGRRPCLILTRAAAIPLLNSVLVAPATRTVRGIPVEVQLDRADGMPDACALSLDNLRQVPKSALLTRICTLGPERLLETCVALRLAVDC